MIVIPITCGHFPMSVQLNKKFVDWVSSHYKNGVEIASHCVGSFFLASTGLLDNRNCAVHWAARNEFRTMFPHVKLVDDHLITDEEGIHTCGGAYSYLNLLLYIIEKHLGREMSVLASKMFEIDIDRKNQNQFVIFLGQKSHNDDNVLEAQNFIERNYEKKLTGNSVIEYIQRVKVEAVKKQLELGRKTINEIVYEVGYNDVNAFRTLFKRCTGLSPVDYRKKYHS